MGILMRHSEEGETSERRAGGQTKGLLLKVSSSGDACRVACVIVGRREWALQTLPLPTLLGKPLLILLLTPQLLESTFGWFDAHDPKYWRRSTRLPK